VSHELVRPFIARLDDPENGPPNSFFDPLREVHVARAPGRLDVMGGIADYSGSQVLELPLALATRCAVQPSDDGALAVVSRTGATLRRCALPLAEVREADAAGLRRALADWGSPWAGHVVGILHHCHHDLAAGIGEGWRIYCESEVPEGCGVAASAALEVATLTALADALDLDLDGPTVARACESVARRVIGDDRGLMDQMSAACGVQDRMLRMLCQPDLLDGPVALPDGLACFGIDSGTRHEVAAEAYRDVRCAAFMGLRILADLENLPVEVVDGRARIDDHLWEGHLANVDLHTWVRDYRGRVPERLGGGEFLERYGAGPDDTTAPDPDRDYPVRQATGHPIHEHHRVVSFADLLQVGDLAGSEGMGALMYASHDSYSACGLGSDATDELVERCKSAGPDAGIYGARITGAGSGGTVAVLARADAEETVRAIAAAYAARHDRGGTVFAGSSPGAIPFGPVRARPGQPP